MANRGVQRFCGELTERGLFLERLLVFENENARDPQPLISWTTAPADAHKLALVLDKAARGESLQGRFIVYLMTVQRRPEDSAGLAVASLLSKVLKKPLLVVEAMSGNAPWSSERVHSFIGQGAAANAARCEGYLFVPQGHDPAIEPEKNVSAKIDSSLAPELAFTTGLVSQPSNVPNSGIVAGLLEDACAVICDWAAFYIFPDIAVRSHRATARRAPHAPFVLVDDCGLVPLFKYAKVEAAARFIRPKLKPFIAAAETERSGIEKMIAERLVFSDKLSLNGELLIGDAAGRTKLDPREYGEAITAFAGVSRSVAGVRNLQGGADAALCRLREFLETDINRYGEERNHPDEGCSSHLSPWLHFGMIHPRTILAETARRMGCNGADHIHTESSAGKFVDELVTWRELGQNMAHYAYRGGIALGNLQLVPQWAQDTLRKFAPPQEKQVSLEKLEAAESPDPVWNAAQRELIQTGVIHNYMRMLWGKGIVRWSDGPQDALQKLEYLNNKYSLDGRDPNSYTGIYWCLGKYDRPWPPAREPFGLVRSMTTASAQKKLHMQGYLNRYSCSKY
jgi:deoxyribodipyrimidine photo-lyase